VEVSVRLRLLLNRGIFYFCFSNEIACTWLSDQLIWTLTENAIRWLYCI